MIRITYKLANDLELKVKGHAPKGMEHVCAAVSALTDTLADMLCQGEKTEENSVVLGDGYGCICSKIRENRPYFEFAVNGMKLIAEAYPRWVAVLEAQVE